MKRTIPTALAVLAVLGALALTLAEARAASPAGVHDNARMFSAEVVKTRRARRFTRSRPTATGKS